MSAAIATRGLRREFAETVAVRDLDLEIEKGSITALVGPNGAGKTTLLRLISGLLEPTSGSVAVEGFEMEKAPREARARLGFLPDHFGIYEDLTPRQFLRYFARAYRWPRLSVESRIVEVLEDVGLSEKIDEPAEGLSRGMKQRLGLARTILHEPPLLLLDEPASGLDPGSRQDLQNLLRRYAARGGTILVSSHILAELEEYCTHVAILDRGRLVHHGSIAAAATQRRRMSLRVHPGPVDAKLLEGRAGVSRAAVRGDALEFEVDGGDEAAAALLRALVAAGVPVVSYAAIDEKIQDRYLALVRSRD